MDIANIDVSIIIPARNEQQNIGKCCDALLLQDTNYSFEIIVIDSGSEDQTPAIVKEYIAGSPNHNISLIQVSAREFGHGKTRNLGAEKARGNTLVFLNADALPVGRHWLNALMENLVQDEEKKVAGVFSRHLPRPGCYLYMVRDIREMMPERRIVKSRRKNFDFMIFSTVSCAIRQEVWQQFPFDHDIIIAEDQEWARRILANGYHIVYEPASQVLHSHNYRPAELFAVKKKVGQSERKFKHRLPALMLGFVLLGGAFCLKFLGDILFIIRLNYTANPGDRPLSPLAKMRQVGIAFAARAAGFWGRYRGWQSKENE